jgi:hypothetical protein
MCSDLVVIGSVVLQDTTQLRFVEHDQVIEALAPDRSDEAFDIAILPGWRGAVG